MTKLYLEKENLADWNLICTTAGVQDKQKFILNNNYSLVTYSAKNDRPTIQRLQK